MPVAAYYAWVHAGRPLTPAQPVRELVAALKQAYPAAARGGSFGWYANENHYQADVPEDHTPFSADEWPVPCPRDVVFATDVLGGADLPQAGLDALAAYWIGEAKAGRMPALKYLIYRDKIHDVRHGWREEHYNGEYHSHIHLSFRTDYETRGFTSWSPIPGEEMSLTDKQAYVLHSLYWRVAGLIGNLPVIRVPAYGDRPEVVEQNRAASTTALLVKAVAAVEVRDKVAAAAAAALTDLVRAGGGNVDTAAVLAKLDQVATTLTRQQTTIVADLTAEVDRLNQALLAGARASADVLDG